MKYQITGTTMPVLELSLDPGDKIVAESGELSWMGAGMKLHTSMAGGGGGGGLFGAVKRKIAGGSFWMTEYTTDQAGDELAFCTRVPGHIVPVTVSADNEPRIHRHGFLCAVEGVNLELAFQQKFSSGIFGGEGFRLQKLTGSGLAFIELSGELIERDLAAGQVLRAHPGHVGMFEKSVQFEITTVPGIKNKFLGGDGLFLAKMTGPGKVWLQTLPLPNLAAALTPFIAADLPQQDDN